MKADLHLHTINSDGSETIDTLIQNLKSQGHIEGVISVVDHHYLTVQEVQRLQNYLIVPGIEISGFAKEHSCHFVAYAKKPVMTLRLQNLLKSIVEGYQNRAVRMRDKLINLGYDVGDLEEIRSSKLPKPIYTYDLAHALGKVLKIQNDKEVIKWSKNNGDILYVEEDNFLPDSREIIETMHEAGFIIGLAHPGTRFLKEGQNLEEFENLIKELVDQGIDLVEVFYSKHTQEQTEEFVKIAEKYKLLKTGGSDYHGYGRGPEKPELMLQEGDLDHFLKKLNILY